MEQCDQCQYNAFGSKNIVTKTKIICVIVLPINTLPTALIGLFCRIYPETAHILKSGLCFKDQLYNGDSSQLDLINLKDQFPQF